jgi:uncharacterized protein Yka (UPF0111/DUF47 family)
MLGRLLPRERRFFDLFDRHAALTVEAARELRALVSTGADIGPRAKRIEDLEHAADAITHECVEALHQAFITPINREDIHRLISRLDDVIDLVQVAAGRICLYELADMTPGVKELADVLVRSAEEVALVVRDLRDLRRAPAVRERCVDVNRLENEADTILLAALARLFRTEKNPVAIIQWKEVYEIMETATDRCEDVANIVEGVLLEHE